MKIIILDFSDGIVKIIPNTPSNIDYEEFLTEKFNFSMDSIEYMVVPDLEIEYLKNF